MLLSPLGQDENTWARTVERASRGWWTVLLSGAISVVAGMIILSIDWTVADLAVFVGAYLIFRGLVQMLNGPLSASLWGYYLTTGALSVIAGIFVVAWPGPTLLVIAIFIGVSIVVFGIMNVAGAIGSRARAGSPRDPSRLLVAPPSWPDARGGHHRHRSLGCVRRCDADRGVVRDPTFPADLEL
jgi:uncharacterized membrane protein HdeD (DUF308 family)